MDGPVGQVVHRALAVDGAAQRVEHAAQRAFAHRGVQAVAGGSDHHALAKTLAGRKHDAAHRRLVDVLRHFHRTLGALGGHRQRFLQGRQLALGELDVHHGARYANNSSLYHTIAFLIESILPQSQLRCASSLGGRRHRLGDAGRSKFYSLFCTAAAPPMISVISCVMEP